MADPSKPKPILQKPPGYKDPNTPLISKPPPRKPPPVRPVYRQKRKRRSCCCCCCCFLCILLLVIIILAAIAGGIFYLWYKPKLPSFQIQSVQTPRFKVSVRPDGTYLDSQTIIHLLAKNPNTKIGFSYGRTDVRMVGEDGVNLGSGSLAAFNQGTRNSTVLKLATLVKDQMIDDDVGRRLKSRFQSKQLAMEVEVRTRFGIRLGHLRIGKVAIKVLCQDVRLKKVSGGASPKCKINLLKWINLS